MNVTREECQICPYKLRHESYIVICFPCIREVIAEREDRAKNRQNVRKDCFCRRDVSSNG